MNGWIKLHRQLLNKPIWLESTPEQKTILITLLMMANHQEKEWEWRGEKYKAKPGEFVTSLHKIAGQCGKGVSTQNIRTAILRFERYEFLTSKSTNKNRLISIVNWGFYQGDGEPPNKQTNIATNKQLTSNQQATNKQLTTNKNVRRKEGKKYKETGPQKRLYAETVSLTENEYNKLLENHGQENTTRIIEILNNYKLSTGKTYKSDYHAILNWVVKRLEEEKPKGKYQQKQTQGNYSYDGNPYDDLDLYKLQEG